MYRNIGVILGAGMGIRFAQSIPKQFNKLQGREVISYVIDAFRASCKTEKLLVVLSKDEYKKGEVAQKYNIETVCGGKTRPQSVNNALRYIADHYPSCENVIFHDAARPLIKAEVFDRYFMLLQEYDYICTCQKITDSLGSYKKEMPNREDYYLLQTPEGYRFRLLYESLDKATDQMKNFYASYALPPESKGYLCFDIRNNFKVTYPEDLQFLECWMQAHSTDTEWRNREY